jgi:hypothetical protein
LESTAAGEAEQLAESQCQSWCGAEMDKGPNQFRLACTKWAKCGGCERCSDPEEIEKANPHCMAWCHAEMDKGPKQLRLACTSLDKCEGCARCEEQDQARGATGSAATA